MAYLVLQIFYSLIFIEAFFGEASMFKAMTKESTKRQENSHHTTHLEENPEDVDVICNGTQR